MVTVYAGGSNTKLGMRGGRLAYFPNLTLRPESEGRLQENYKSGLSLRQSILQPPLRVPYPSHSPMLTREAGRGWVKQLSKVNRVFHAVHTPGNFHMIVMTIGQACLEKHDLYWQGKGHNSTPKGMHRLANAIPYRKLSI